MFKKKLFSASALLVLTALILSACSGAPSSPAPTQAPPVPAAATNTPAAPAASPTPAFKPVFMTVNLEQQATWVRNFNPFSPDARLQASNGVIYEPLMIFNKSTAQLVPWLADSYSWNADNTVLTFK